MVDVKAILSDPNYVNANPATKRAIFDKRIASDPVYAQANPATQSAIRKKFGLTDDAAPAPAADRTPMQYLGETAGNIIPSGAAMIGGMYEAVTNPVETAKGLGLAAYGGARNLAEYALPTEAFDVVKSVENPEIAQQAVQVANAIGGIYKERYGSVNQLLDTIRTDPVGAAADLSAVLSLGAGTATKLPVVSGALRTAARVADPIAEVAGRTVGGAARLGAAGINRMTTSAETRFIANELAAGRGQELATAAREAPRYPGVTPTFAEATTEVPVPRIQAFGREAAEKQDVAAEVGSRAKQAKILEDLKTISKTPEERAALEKARDVKAKEEYGRAFAQNVAEDKTLRSLFATPSMQKAVAEASKIAAEQKVPFALGKTKPQQTRVDPTTGKIKITPATTAKYSVQNLHIVKQALDDILKNPDQFGIGATEARAIGDTRTKFLGWLEDKVPQYKDARQNYASASKEIARADWGDFAVQKLTSSMSEDAPLRARNFTNAIRESLGPNAPASLKRAIGGGSRYDDLTKLLTEDEMKIVNDVVGQLGREEMASGMAQRGAGAAPKLEDLSKTEKVQLFNQMWTLAQAAYSRIAGGLSEAKKTKLALAMLNADTMADLMEKAAKKQRNVNVVTKPIRAAGRAAQTTIAGPVGTVAGRLETEANRNAFLTDALGRSYDVQGNRMSR
jgi:hypothetical protein